MAERGEDLGRLDRRGGGDRGAAPAGDAGCGAARRPGSAASRTGAPISMSVARRSAVAWISWPSESTGSPGDPPTVALSEEIERGGRGLERAGDLDDHVAIDDLLEVERDGHAGIHRGRADVLLQQGVTNEEVQQRRAEAFLGGAISSGVAVRSHSR